MKTLILDKYVVVECGKFEKYGRLLGTIYVGTGKGRCPSSDARPKDVKRLGKLIKVGEWMTRNTPSYWYDGGKKQEFDFRGGHYPDTYTTFLEKYRKELGA
jgi:hypothetical protein